MTDNKTNREKLIEKYLGKRVQIKYDNSDKILEGRVLKVTEDRKLIGSWGDEVIEPETV